MREIVGDLAGVFFVAVVAASSTIGFIEDYRTKRETEETLQSKLIRRETENTLGLRTNYSTDPSPKYGK